MCNPAKFTIRLGLFLRKKRWAHCLLSAIKVVVAATLLAMCFIFFVNHNRRLPRGDGGSLARSSFLRFVGSARPS